jgi:hypothetical protein
METAVSSGDPIDQLASQSSRRAMMTFLRARRDLWDPQVVERLYERVHGPI